LRAFFGDYRAVQITSDRIRANAAFWKESGAANATVNRELDALKRSLRLGSEAGKAGELPPTRLLAEDNARRGFFERAELEAVLEHLAPCCQPVFEVAYVIGWRAASEVLTCQREVTDSIERATQKIVPWV